MKRRDVITLRVGVLWYAANAEEEGPYFKALVEGFAALGYVDGHTITLHHRFPNETPELFQRMAADLVALKSDVLVSVGNVRSPVGILRPSRERPRRGYPVEAWRRDHAAERAGDAEAANGLRYTNFNSTALCSPTRAAIITGRNHHSMGFGVVAEQATGYPGYNSLMSRDKATIGKILKDHGYWTSWFGKDHNTPDFQA